MQMWREARRALTPVTIHWTLYIFNPDLLYQNSQSRWLCCCTCHQGESFLERAAKQHSHQQIVNRPAVDLDVDIEYTDISAPWTRTSQGSRRGRDMEHNSTPHALLSPLVHFLVHPHLHRNLSAVALLVDFNVQLLLPLDGSASCCKASCPRLYQSIQSKWRCKTSSGMADGTQQGATNAWLDD
jgi:hypothetical protein